MNKIGKLRLLRFNNLAEYLESMSLLVNIDDLDIDDIVNYSLSKADSNIEIKLMVAVRVFEKLVAEEKSEVGIILKDSLITYLFDFRIRMLVLYNCIFEQGWFNPEIFAEMVLKLEGKGKQKVEKSAYKLITEYKEIVESTFYREANFISEATREEISMLFDCSTIELVEPKSDLVRDIRDAVNRRDADKLNDILDILKLSIEENIQELKVKLKNSGVQYEK